MEKSDFIHTAAGIIILPRERSICDNTETIDDNEVHDEAGEHRTKTNSPNPFMSSWRQWANETTLHGIKVIADGRENKLKRLTRILVMCTFLGCLAYLCYDQTMRYLQYNTVTKESIKFEEEIDFPAVTICNHEFLHVDHKLNSREDRTLRYLYGWPRSDWSIWYMKQTSRSLRQLLDDQFVNVTEIFNFCYFGSDELPCTELFVKRLTKYGTCFTFNSEKLATIYSTSLTGSDYGLSLEVNTNQDQFELSHDCSTGIKVLIHPRGELPDMVQPLTLAPGLTHYIAITKHEYTYLPKPVQAFDTRECVETNSADFVSPLKYFSPYSTASCFSECLMLYVNNTCACIGPFFMVGNDTTFVECKPKDYILCHEKAVARFSKERKVVHCDCPIPCNSIQFETKLSSAKYPSKKTVYFKTDLADFNYARENLLQVRIYFDNKIVTTHKQVLEYEFADLLGSVGGYLGLALGASLLTILELLEQIVISCHGVYNNRKTIHPEDIRPRNKVVKKHVPKNTLSN